MDIGVIGGGSLGLLLSSYLSLDHDVTLYVRRESQINHINDNGITLKLLNKYKRKTKVTVQLIDKLQNHNLIFITVKQPQIDDVIAKLQKMDPNNHFVFLQNGMGHIEEIMLLPANVYVGVVEHGATRLSDSEVNHLGIGTIKLAALKNSENNVTYFKRMLNSEPFPFEATADWEMLLKSKLLINAVINPLTALFDVQNGAIVTNSHLQNLAQKLTNEAAKVLGFNEDEAWENVRRVARNTAENTSSMRSDIIHHRETEIEAICGYLLKIANYNGIPYCSFVYEAVLALQTKRDF